MTNLLAHQTGVNVGLEAGEGAAADEENVGGVDLNVLGLRPAPRLGDRHHRPFEHLEQGLLYPLARHVPHRP